MAWLVALLGRLLAALAALFRRRPAALTPVTAPAESAPSEPPSPGPPVMVAPLAPSEPAEPPWLAVALAEVGQREVPGAGANPRIVEYHAATTLRATSDEVAWCAAFVSWVLERAGFRSTRSAAAASYCDWGEPSLARRGSIVVLHNPAARGSNLTRSGNHVGFLLSHDRKRWVVLGGNQSDSVKVSDFAKARWTLKACRWPLPGPGARP